MGEVALFKLPNRAKAHWPLVRILQTFPDDDQVICTVKILKPDLSEMVVNVNHLISLELYFQLENPQVYNDGSNNSAQVGGDLEEDNNVSEIDVSVSASAADRPSRSIGQASRAQTRVLASRGLI